MSLYFLDTRRTRDARVGPDAQRPEPNAFPITQVWESSDAPEDDFVVSLSCVLWSERTVCHYETSSCDRTFHTHDGTRPTNTQAVRDPVKKDSKPIVLLQWSKRTNDVMSLRRHRYGL
ncbi:hypothetical protein FVE85_8832 [Porphyridium purpureum]|uniref:Uncharacterized protein n=1 Tax=Porphyridium purpureum TaxID=35688 RepID=A0A5J4YSH9_PORPP|nr:hypothetical protein FVE85_8832 [Porphyridium purpureum]|eukprot:POR2235..scf296_7